VNHKFHYDSIKQAQKWLALHQACSPSQTDPDCTAVYDRSFQAAVSAFSGSSPIQLIGLGCGSGQKEARLLQLFLTAGRSVRYLPCDVSTALVLVAYQAARSIQPSEQCEPLVCDLLRADDLPELLNDSVVPGAIRIVTFFGMIPNFESEFILPRLMALLRPGDYLLLSANLAPGPDYLSGIQKVLPLYDNALTREWLMTFLLDLGVERNDGSIGFVIENGAVEIGLKRIAAYFQFVQPRSIQVGEEKFQFQTGEFIRLFFSCRHTPEQIRGLLGSHKIAVLDQWITRSEEEGVFLCRRV
jgi:L-histidine N-alpha-methyltransferase